MSDFYGPADEAESIATIHAALDAGITLLDTGDYYGMGHNELLLREALRGRDRDRVIISVKFGLMRGPDGAIVGLDGRPAAVRNSLAYTLRRLGTDHVDIYRLGRVDPAVPLAIGWVLSRGPGIVPLVGARRRDRLAEALGALPLELTADDLAAIERAVPAGAAAGDRDHAHRWPPSTASAQARPPGEPPGADADADPGDGRGRPAPLRAHQGDRGRRRPRPGRPPRQRLPPASWPGSSPTASPGAS
jgi:diketogulonate reductase-like aldo/keto reductase